jgi:proline dehydrogenase
MGIAIQAYLHRTPGDLDDLIPLGGKIRLCKGAYDEPAEAAHRSQEEVDAAYRAALRQLLAPDAAAFAAIATHDEAMLAAARALQPRPGRYEFQMLFGVRNELQQRILDRGEPLRVYVPYGAHWFPYFMRRLAERPANLRFFLRALFGA